MTIALRMMSLFVVVVSVCLAAETKPGTVLKPVLDRPLQDVAICRGADAWYLTGTLPSAKDPADFATNDGVEVWRSTDLAAWTSLGQVWNIERDAPASPASAWQLVRRPGGRGITAPEIHFLKDTYWIPYSMNGWGTGLLKSRTGKPEGPYEDLGRFTAQGGGDPSLFQDDDGTVYWLWGAALIAPLKPDLRGLAGPPVSLLSAMHSIDPFSFLRSFTLNTRVSGAFLCKVRGTYQLSFASWANRLGSPCHDTLIASASRVLGPYKRPMMFTNHTGQVTVFPSGKDSYAASCWGGDAFAPFPSRAAVLPLTWDDRYQTLMRVRLDAFSEKGPWDRLTPIHATGGPDPEILYAPNGWYYYTASAQVEGRLLVYRSRDLKTWEELTVATAEQVIADPLWPAEPINPKDKHQPAVPAKLRFWEGSIMWHQDRLWIVSGLMGVQAPGGKKAGMGLWCSPKDGADGAFTSRGRIAGNDGVSLFADDDGSAYICTGFGLLRKFKADMSGLDESWGRYDLTAWAQGIQVNYDCGWFLSKIGGKYVAQAIQVQGAYCSTYGIADRIRGPYRYIGVSHPHGGNSLLSRTKEGGWMQILFGNTDYYVPFEMSQGPRITPMVVDTSGQTVRIRME